MGSTGEQNTEVIAWPEDSNEEQVGENLTVTREAISDGGKKSENKGKKFKKGRRKSKKRSNRKGQRRSNKSRGSAKKRIKGENRIIGERKTAKKKTSKNR